MLVRHRVELISRFRVLASRTFEIAALRVQDRDCGLNQPLQEELLGSLSAQPDFLPLFVALEEASLVEEVDAALENSILL